MSQFVDYKGEAVASAQEVAVVCFVTEVWGPFDWMTTAPARRREDESPGVVVFGYVSRGNERARGIFALWLLEKIWPPFTRDWFAGFYDPPIEDADIGGAAVRKPGSSTPIFVSNGREPAGIVFICDAVVTGDQLPGLSAGERLSGPWVTFVDGDLDLWDFSDVATPLGVELARYFGAQGLGSYYVLTESYLGGEPEGKAKIGRELLGFPSRLIWSGELPGWCDADDATVPCGYKTDFQVWQVDIGPSE